ncbi:PH domain-containing protein [Mucilaginibacter sp. JRF]|uniref:PH domain-containing protein n=1 Tax=Mucilaginibacter sp. JRF TaxID=2780088 RepID=UPI00187F6C52|nr:PH domain-containing protein [Mucilaginibacter sp. JRF]MBE9583944.1 PH domain-containing protein [Mucilaginibacter sp. JRF]
MIINTDLSLSHEIQAEILPGEKQLWVGKPKAGIQFRKSDALFIPFSIFWAGFAIFWFVGVFMSGAPYFLLFFGIPFVCAGLYITVGRFFYDSYKRGKTLYAVTDKRVIIKNGGIKGQTVTLNIKSLQDISIIEKQDGSGTITFNSNNSFPSIFGQSNWPGTKRPQAPTLEFITDVRAVYNLIIKQQIA